MRPLQTLESPNHNEGVLLRSGVLMCIGFIGASAVAAAVVQFAHGDVEPLRALALGCLGGVLAVAGWWRGRRLLQPRTPPSRGTAPMHTATHTRTSARL